MDEQKTIEEENLPGVPLLYDSNGKLIGVMSEEEYERAHKDFDDEYMCPKCIADWKRSMGIPPLFSRKGSPQQ